MGAPVSAALYEGQMVGILDALRELLDLLGEKVGVIRYRNELWDLSLGLLRGMDHVLVILYERPLERFLRTVDIEGLTVLAGRVEEETPDVGGDVRVLQLDVAALYGARVSGFLGELLADGS